MVPYEQSYTALTEQVLSRQCGRPVDVQNLAVAGIHLTDAVNRTDEALALKPDLVILVMTPYDLWKDIDDLESGVSGEVKPRIPPPAEVMKIGDVVASSKEMLRESSAVTVIRHFLYEHPDIYLKFYLQSNRGASDFLSVPFSAPWKNGFNHLDMLLGDMKTRTQAQGIPVAIVPSFHRPQVALMSEGDAFPGKDPFAFEREIAKIAAKHEILDLEVTESFRNADQPEELFYLADGHMAPKGHAVLAGAIARQILASRVLESAGCAGVPAD